MTLDFEPQKGRFLSY